MNKYQELWQQWITAISKTALTNTEYYNIVNGIAAGDEKMYEAQLQKPFPDDIIAFYSVHNVAYHPVASAFTFIINGCSYNLLSFDMIVERYNEILDVGTSFDEEDSANNYIDINISEKINIKEFTNPKWIPFAETDQGNYLLYDTDPTDKGTFGQIIELQNDSWQRNLVANSIEDLIQKQIVAIEANPEEALPLYLIPKPNLWTFGETVVLQEISFMVCSQEKANALLPQIIMPMSEDVNYFGTLLDKI